MGNERLVEVLKECLAVIWLMTCGWYDDLCKVRHDVWEPVVPQEWKCVKFDTEVRGSNPEPGNRRNLV